MTTPALHTPLVQGSTPRRQPKATRLKEKVLLIEDEKDLNQALAMRLRQSGYKVIQAYDGLGGLGNAARTLPDVIVLDLRLPELNGFDLLHRLNAIPQAKDIPVIIATGDPDPALEVKASLWNVVAVLRKPFSHQRLTRAIRRALRA